MIEQQGNVWKKCNACKKGIGFKVIYWTCSVSTCNTKRNTLKFCSVSCWDSHVPIYNHRSAWALEQTSPTREEAAIEDAKTAPSVAASSASGDGSQKRRVLVDPKNSAGAAVTPHANHKPETTVPRKDLPKDTLIVVSKLKDYIKQSSDMNTSGDVAEVLSNKVRALCERAIVEARQDGRKTVMGKDFKS